MTRLISRSLSLLLLSLLGACGGSDDSNPTDTPAETLTEVPFAAAGGSYAALYNNWQLPYLLFTEGETSRTQGGITTTLNRLADGGWNIRQNGQDAVLHITYNNWLAQRWTPLSGNGLRGRYERFHLNTEVVELSLTYQDDGRVRLRRYHEDTSLAEEGLYQQEENEVRVASDTADLAPALTITDTDGTQASLYSGCSSAPDTLIGLSVSTLNSDCQTLVSEGP